jgi:hypothetical protein
MRVLRINDLHSIDRKAPQRQATFQLDIAPPVTVRGMVIPAMSTATTVPPSRWPARIRYATGKEEHDYGRSAAH